MRFRNADSPTEEELRAWAFDPAAPPPVQDWDLVLAWNMDRGALGQWIELASDPNCPKAGFFLSVLYHWVEQIVRGKQFDYWGPIADRWLEEVRGIQNPAVKRWRHRARLILQRQESFDRESWWERWRADAANG